LPAAVAKTLGHLTFKMERAEGWGIESSLLVQYYKIVFPSDLCLYLGKPSLKFKEFSMLLA
jgi:hypothetical protein